MADDRLQQAVDIVARRVIARQAERWVQHAWDTWTDFPGLSEATWQQVLDRITDIAVTPTKEQYAAAYDFLVGRAGGEAP